MKLLKIINFSLFFALGCLLLSCATGGGGATSPITSGAPPQSLGGGPVGGDLNNPPAADHPIVEAHAAPGADPGSVAPLPDYIPPWTLTLKCYVASCAVVGIDSDLLGNSYSSSDPK